MTTTLTLLNERLAKPISCISVPQCALSITQTGEIWNIARKSRSLSLHHEDYQGEKKFDHLTSKTDVVSQFLVRQRSLHVVQLLLHHCLRHLGLHPA